MWRCSCVLAFFSVLGQSTVMQPLRIMTGSGNITKAPRLSHPIVQQVLLDDYIHVTPSNQSRMSPDDPYLPYPGFWTCPRDTALPPNTEDCLQVITDTFRTYGNMSMDIPADRCMQVFYRSCIMYTCSSSCEGFQWNFAEWQQLAMYIQKRCIWGRGGGGYIQRQPGGGEGPVYRTGLAHVDDAGRLMTPALVC